MSICLYVQDVNKVCTQQAYMKEWIKACALLVSIIVQLLAKSTIGKEQR